LDFDREVGKTRESGEPLQQTQNFVRDLVKTQEVNLMNLKELLGDAYREDMTLEEVPKRWREEVKALDGEVQK